MARRDGIVARKSDLDVDEEPASNEVIS